MTAPVLKLPKPQEIAATAEAVLRSPAAQEARHVLLDKAREHRLSIPSGYVPGDAQTARMMEDLRRGLGLPSESNEALEVKSQVLNDQILIPRDAQQDPVKCFQVPEKGAAREMMRSMVADTFPHASAAQDGLNLFAKGQMPQVALGGEKLTSSAALLMPKAQVQAFLLACSEIVASPEMTKALGLLQAAVPALVHGAESEALSELMQKFLGANGADGAEFARFVGALAEVFQHSGLGSMSDAQHLILHLLDASGLGVQESELKNLTHPLQAAQSSGLPMLGGLREFLGGNAMQGLNQILQPLLRLLSGLFLSRPQNQFPNCLPNERFLVDLSALFASQSRGPQERKFKKRKKRKGLPGMLDYSEGESEDTGINDVVHGILERLPAIA